VTGPLLPGDGGGGAGRPTGAPGFCRDCLAEAQSAHQRCMRCGSPRLLRHPELDQLAIAHVDCDAFYAAVEKRDDPSLADQPLIIGGGRRGVVATACYIARTYGVRSAMPMFQARKLCPQAIVIPPNMEKYAIAGRAVRALMLELTPLVEPLSIDEAFMDLTGTARLHGASPARSLARFAKTVETTIGITVSVGLAPNKFLAKIASDLDKPRGFAVLGNSEAPGFLAPRPVSFIWGIGKATEARLQRDGFRTIGDLQQIEQTELMRRYGAEGARLARLSRGIDDRAVRPERETKSVSAETTFDRDIAAFRPLERQLWLLAEKVSARLKAKEFVGGTVTLKLKSADFRLRTRARSLADATDLADTIFTVGRDLLARETDGTRFRLLGIGVSALAQAGTAPAPDWLEPRRERASAAEHAVDSLRERFGRGAVIRGLAFDGDDEL
jgi:DNA polymerase-4